MHGHMNLKFVVSVIEGFLTIAKIYLLVNIFQFSFYCHLLGLKFFYTLSFQKCLFASYLSLLVSRFLMNILVLSVIVFFSLHFSFLDIYLFLKIFL